MPWSKNNLFIFSLLAIFAVIIFLTLYRYQSLAPQADVQQTPPAPTPNATVPTVQKDSLLARAHVDIQAFVRATRDPETLIVDLRDAQAFHKEHIRGSVLFDRIDPRTITAKNIAIFADASVPTAVQKNAITTLDPLTSPQLFVGSLETYKDHGGLTVRVYDAQKLSDRSTVTFVEPRDLAKNLTQNPPPIIVDVRRTGNFEKGHIAHAQNIPLATLEKNYHTLLTISSPIYVYGADDAQSFQAGALLFDLGIFNAKTIHGGFAAWQKFGYPVVK